jgi:Pyruvate/2-oxoacid:ferredoxin oxidoreductase delta subunit
MLLEEREMVKGVATEPVASRTSRIRKIPPELRRGKPSYRSEARRLPRLRKRWADDSQFQRSVIQFAFAALCIWIGVEFALFMAWGTSGGAAPYFDRPPGAEGFLPISALISMKYWLHTGIINNIHPSGLVILFAILAVSVVLKKAFCSWLCPVGTLSESLWMLGKRLFGRTFDPPRWLDYPLRSLKYLLMAFFVVSIVQMDASDLAAFIYSPYNKMADVKMYLFFADITPFALWTIIVLVLLSVVIRNFWCRFLCPYGALLGIAGWLSPLKITRTKDTCIDCALCTKACPSRINVHTATRVWSDECTSCMACVAACPVKNTLELRAATHAPAVPSKVYGVLVAGVFVAVIGAAMLGGFWHNGITKEEYRKRFNTLNAPVYNHFRGQVPAYGPED